MQNFHIKSIVSKLEEKNIPLLFLKSNTLVLSEMSLYIPSKFHNIFIQSVYEYCKEKSICFSICKKSSKYLELCLFAVSGRMQTLHVMDISFSTCKENKEVLKRESFDIRVVKNMRFIPVIGPDGVGKTTLISKVIEKNKLGFELYRFKHLYRKSFLYYISYKLLRKKKALWSDKNEFDNDYNRLCYIASLFRFPTMSIKYFFLKKRFLVDRYFYDYLIKDLRHTKKSASLDKFWNSMLSFIPKRVLLIQVDAPNEEILKRKQEMLDKNIDFYRKKVFDFYIKHPSTFYLYINTKNDLEMVSNVVNKVVTKIYGKQ